MLMITYIINTLKKLMLYEDPRRNETVACYIVNNLKKCWGKITLALLF